MKTPTKLTCPKCPGKTFSKLSNLKRHLERHNKKQVISKPRNLDRHRAGFCSPCKRVIRSKWSRHRRTAHNDKAKRVTPTEDQLNGYEADEDTYNHY